MRLQPERVEDAISFVQQQRPCAQLLNRAPDRLSFSIPQQVCQRANNPRSGPGTYSSRSFTMQYAVKFASAQYALSAA